MQPVKSHLQPAIDAQLEATDFMISKKWETDPDREFMLRSSMERYIDYWPHVPELGSIVLAHARKAWPEWAVAVIESMQPFTPTTKPR